MNCKKCGAPLAAEDRFCKNCGTAVEVADAQPTIMSTESVNGNTNLSGGGNVTENLTGSLNANVNVSGNGNVPGQGVNNGVPSQPVNTNGTNNSKKSIFIVAGAVAVVIIVLSVVFVPKFLSGNKETKKSSGDVPVAPISSPAATSFYKVNFKDFTFKIPDNLIYEISLDSLLVMDEDDTWMAEISIGDGNFSQLKTNKSSLQGYFQQSGYNAKPAEIKNISGSEFITLEMERAGTNILAAYVKLNSMKISWIVAYTRDNDFDYDVLEKMVPIVSTASYNDVSTSIAAEKKFDFNMDEISSFAR